MLQCDAACYRIYTRIYEYCVVASAPDEDLLYSQLDYKQYRMYVLQCDAVCFTVLQCVVVCRASCVSKPGLHIVQNFGSVLYCVAVCCSVLQCVAVCCSVLQCVAVCCSVLRCVAMCFSVVLPCVVCTVCCSVIQYVAVCCSVLQCVTVCCSALRCVAMRCSMLQCVLQSIIHVICIYMYENTYTHI